MALRRGLRLGPLPRRSPSGHRRHPRPRSPTIVTTLPLVTGGSGRQIAVRVGPILTLVSGPRRPVPARTARGVRPTR